MKAEFEVSITTKDMYNFNMYHNYHNIFGITSILLGILMFVLAFITAGEAKTSYTLIMCIFGALFTIITPFRIQFKSLQQVKLTPMFKKPLKYTVTEEKIIVEQDDIKSEVEWADVYKVKDTGKSIVIYLSSVRAYIFPKRDLKEQEQVVVDIARKVLNPKQVKIKSQNGY